MEKYYRGVVLFPKGQDVPQNVNFEASETTTSRDGVLAQPSLSQGFIHQRVWLNIELTHWLERGR